MPEEIKVKTVTKRSGHTENFDPERILRAITKANLETGEMDESIIPDIVAATTASLDTHVTVETIQDVVEKEIAKAGYFETAKAYILYRDKRRRQREGNDYLMGELYHQLLFTDSKDMDLKRDNANINSDSPMGIMLKLGTEGAKSYLNNYVLPEKFREMHKKHIQHVHKLHCGLVA